MSELINITVLHNDSERLLEVPTDVGLNLMELLKAADYEKVEGLCGGMALCATCHVRLLESEGNIGEPADDELAMLETLPQMFDNSRLACQIKLTDQVKRLKIELAS